MYLHKKANNSSFQSHSIGQIISLINNFLLAILWVLDKRHCDFLYTFSRYLLNIKGRLWDRWCWFALDNHALSGRLGITNRQKITKHTREIKMSYYMYYMSIIIDVSGNSFMNLEQYFRLTHVHILIMITHTYYYYHRNTPINLAYFVRFR